MEKNKAGQMTRKFQARGLRETGMLFQAEWSEKASLTGRLVSWEGMRRKRAPEATKHSVAV